MSVIDEHVWVYMNIVAYTRAGLWLVCTVWAFATCCVVVWAQAESGMPP